MAQVRGETFIELRLREVRTELSDPVAWARKQWGDQVADVERLDDRSARVVLASEGRPHSVVINRTGEDADTVEYVIPPQGRISFTRRIRYELRENGHGTGVAVIESVEPTLGFKLISLGLYLAIAPLMVRSNLRAELERLGSRVELGDQK